MTPTFYEFFAGRGMARAGLGSGGRACSRTTSTRKSSQLREDWGDDHLKVGDVARLTTADLPGLAYLAWASFLSDSS